MERPEDSRLRIVSILLILMGICVTDIAQSEKCSLKPGQIQKTFVTVFMENLNKNTGTTFQLYLVTCDEAATVTVTVPQPFFNETVHVPQDSSRLVTLDYTYMTTGQSLTSKVIMVTSDVAISVFAFNTHSVTSDAMTCLPQEDLGVEYYIITPGERDYEQVSSTIGQFAVANGFDQEVQVHITVSGSITYNGISYNTGDSFTFSLGNQQVIQFQSFDDLTGTRISSSAPVAAFSGHSCYKGSDSACDVLMEQLHPVKNWGNVFAVFPFFAHTQDLITIVAGSPDTGVTIDSPGGATNYSLEEDAYVQITVDKILLINATKPVMVSYLFHEFSRSTGLQYQYDPFLTTVPPSLLGRSYYKFVTQSFYDNFILIVSQVSSDLEFYLDGKPLSSYPTTRREFNGFIGQQVTLGKTEGQHEIYHETSTFTLYVYGTGNYVSYGYSMGDSGPYPGSPHESLIRCLPDGAEYILPYSLVSEAHLDVLDIHLKDPLCRAEEEKDHYLIKIPFTGCGSSVLNEDEKTYYINTIYGTVPGTSVHRIEIPVRCEMQANETLDFSFQPKVTDVVSFGHYNISLRLYQADNFTDLVTTYPYEVDIHGSLHVEFRVESDDEHLQILVEKCKASPTLGESEEIYNLIQQGCSQDSTLQTHLVPDQRLQRFSVHVFKFDNFTEVYLSCNVIICHNGTVPNRCTQGCLTPRHRRDTRSSKEQLRSARLSQGPIRISSDQPQNPPTVPVSALVGVIVVLGLLSVLGLVLQKLHYRGWDYTLLQNMETDN